MRTIKGNKIYTSQIRTIEIYTRLVCGWGEIYTSQYKYEACIKRKNYKEGLCKKRNCGKGLYKKLMIIVIGLFFLLYFCQSIPRKQAGSLVPCARLISFGVPKQF